MTTERRKYPRVGSEGPVFVKILSCNKDETLTGETLYCSTRDLSVGGIKVQCKRVIPEGSILHLWIGSNNQPGTYVLSGRAIWKQEMDDSPTVGIEFVQVENDELQAWKDMVQGLAVKD